MMKQIAQSDRTHSQINKHAQHSGTDSQFFDEQRRKGSSDFTKFEEISEPVVDSTYPPLENGHKGIESFVELFIQDEDAMDNVVATLNNSQYMVTDQAPRIDFEDFKQKPHKN